MKLFQNPGIDEVFWVSGFRSGDLFRQFGEYGLKTFQRGIWLHRDKAFEQLIAFLKCFWLAITRDKTASQRGISTRDRGRKQGAG
jgi:hypothetical protein